MADTRFKTGASPDPDAFAAGLAESRAAELANLQFLSGLTSLTPEQAERLAELTADRPPDRPDPA